MQQMLCLRLLKTAILKHKSLKQQQKIDDIKEKDDAL